jgi:hypothetical protein
VDPLGAPSGAVRIATLHGPAPLGAARTRRREHPAKRRSPLIGLLSIQVSLELVASTLGVSMGMTHEAVRAHPVVCARKEKEEICERHFSHPPCRTILGGRVATLGESSCLG